MVKVVAVITFGRPFREAFGVEDLLALRAGKRLLSLHDAPGGPERHICHGALIPEFRYADLIRKQAE